MLLAWFMFRSIYLCLEMCKKSNIRNVRFQMVKDYAAYVESKKRTFLKQLFQNQFIPLK